MLRSTAPVEWKASLRDRNLLSRLVHDPEPAVVAILLQNPKVTEANVLRLASARPTKPETLLVVVRSVRLLPRPTVLQAFPRLRSGPHGVPSP